MNSLSTPIFLTYFYSKYHFYIVPPDERNFGIIPDALKPPDRWTAARITDEKESEVPENEVDGYLESDHQTDESSQTLQDHHNEAIVESIVIEGGKNPDEVQPVAIESPANNLFTDEELDKDIRRPTTSGDSLPTDNTSSSIFQTLNAFLAGVIPNGIRSSPLGHPKKTSKPVSQSIQDDDFGLSKESKDDESTASPPKPRLDEKGRTVLPLANGRFSLETLSVYTPKNSTFLKPEKTMYNKNANLIKVSIL
jgi:hypothetical protein